MKFTVETDVEVVDEARLTVYTSGILPKEATMADRVLELITRPHTIIPDITGVRVLDSRVRPATEMIAHLPLHAFDVVYGVLNELKDQLLDDISNEVDEEALIDGFLAQFADREALIEWGRQYANGDVDEAHAFWSMEFVEAEDYATEKVNEILGVPD